MYVLKVWRGQELGSNEGLKKRLGKEGKGRVGTQSTEPHLK